MLWDTNMPLGRGVYVMNIHNTEDQTLISCIWISLIIYHQSWTSKHHHVTCPTFKWHFSMRVIIRVRFGQQIGENLLWKCPDLSHLVAIWSTQMWFKMYWPQTTTNLKGSIFIIFDANVDEFEPNLQPYCKSVTSEAINRSNCWNTDRCQTVYWGQRLCGQYRPTFKCLLMPILTVYGL